eukprot:14120434-Alexandrium_andersonii.AAC.1
MGRRTAASLTCPRWGRRARACEALPGGRGSRVLCAAQGALLGKSSARWRSRSASCVRDGTKVAARRKKEERWGLP